MIQLLKNWRSYFLAILFLAGFFFTAHSQTNFRIFPYLQVADQNLVQIRWFSGSNFSSTVLIKDQSGTIIFSSDVNGVEQDNLYYTSLEKNQIIGGLEGQNWIGADKYFRYDYKFRSPFGQTLTYEIDLGGEKYVSQFKSGPDPSNWEKVRFIALADSETEPKGRVTHRAWYPGNPLIRPFAVPTLWRQKFGTTVEEGFEIPNYFLTEKKGFEENLKVIRERNPDFIVMPGDLVQGGGYMPGWDEFWRHTAGEFDKVFTKIPVVPALGNWETFGALNGGYGFNERGIFNPILARSRFHTFFELDNEDPLQKHRQSYYRTDYGPITILTLDSNNGTPEEKRTDTPNDQKLKGKEYSGPGTDTQENYTLVEYQAAGGTDLSGFGPGTAQYQWLEANLKSAKVENRLVFVQFHHIPFASGEHGVPMNHELSTGQGGTPLRVLHPLFEQYGVIAVLSGHDELFERSFVDEDSDGKGVYYYDVGLAGDGMRGVKRDWLNNPLQPLGYNPYSKWTADLSEPEQWNTSGPVPILSDGGKHYGHLEVNLTKVREGDKYFAQIDFDPVYIFPVMNSNYDLERIERRIYNDQVRIFVELGTVKIEPIFKERIIVQLNENGVFETSIKAYLSNDPLPDWKVEFSQSPVYNCSQLGLTENEVKITDSKGNTWQKVVLVEVKDSLPPVLTTKLPDLVLDKVVGVLEITPQIFIESIMDNCTLSSLELSKSRFTCSDLGVAQEIILTAKDQSGNTTTNIFELVLGSSESKKVSLTSSGQLFQGGTISISLGEELDFEVLQWTRDFALIPEAKGKTILVSQPGRYDALLRLSNGCIVNSMVIEISLSEFPFPPVKQEVVKELNADGNTVLEVANLFETWPLPNTSLTFELSKSQFTCSDLGVNEVTLLIKNTTGQSWERKVSVLVKDTIKPTIVPKNLELNLDVTKGIFAITPEMVIEVIRDNCSLKSVTLSKTQLTCEDIGKDISIGIRAEDQSGNVTESVSKVLIKRFEPALVQITGTKEFCAGNNSILELSSSSSFEVVRWRRNGVEIPGQTGKTLEVSESGVYHAVIRYQGGCLSESNSIEVKVNPVPTGEIKTEGNVLIAPEGNFTYQWFRNGEKIESANNRTLTLTMMGEYTVELTNSTGCKAKLPTLTMTISGLGGNWVKNPENLKIYPNPASAFAYVELPVDKLGAGQFEIKVYDLDGKSLESTIQIIQTDSKIAQLSISSLPKGTYIIWVIGSNQSSFVGKLVVL